MLTRRLRSRLLLGIAATLVLALASLGLSGWRPGGGASFPARPVAERAGARPAIGEPVAALQWAEARRVARAARRTEPVEHRAGPLRGAPFRGVEGSVRDGSGRGLPGLEVRLSLRRGLRREELGHVATGAYGGYRLALELTERVSELERAAGTAELPGRRLARTEVCAEVVTRGFQVARAVRGLGRSAPRSVRLDLALEPGSGVHGTVYHRGRPAAGTRLHLFDADWRHVRSTVADAEGSYALALADPGRFHLHARLDGAGAGGTTGYSLGSGLPHLEIDLDVDGLASLHGRLSLRDGTVLAGLRVRALHAALFREELEAGPTPSLAQLALAESEGGLLVCEERTDGEGAFALSGLHAGAYLLRLPGLEDPGVQPRGAFATSGAVHELVLDAHVLVVEVAPERSERAAWRRGGTAQRVEILVQPEPQRGPAGYRPPVRAVVSPGQPYASFLVEPGTTYRVLARTAQLTGVERVRISSLAAVTRLEVELAGFDPELDRELRLASDEEPGWLEVTLSDERGAPLEELSLTLWSAAQGEAEAPLLEAFELRAGALPPALPPDVYDVLVEPRGERAEWLVPPPLQRSVEVRSGEPTALRLAARRGGRLLVRMADVYVPQGYEAASEVRTSLVGGVGSVAALEPLFELQGAPGEWTRELYPGELGISAPIPAGHYTAAFASPWFAPPERAVTIRPGELAEVEPLLVVYFVEEPSEESSAQPGGEPGDE